MHDGGLLRGGLRRVDNVDGAVDERKGDVVYGGLAFQREGDEAPTAVHQGSVARCALGPVAQRLEFGQVDAVDRGGGVEGEWI